MSMKPVLMVLYTNDAVEVRYSDQSRLHVLPCGTSFTYHTQTNSHPVHGMSSIEQRCCFVTSQYRELLISALDFRNRFAERPFLCAELIPSDDIVNLYAQIQQVAWPKSVSRQHCEALEDGSVRVTSVDEFASVILSAHRKDFTVCYLSLLSQEKRREKAKVSKQTSTKSNSRHGEKHSAKVHHDFGSKDEPTFSHKNISDIVTDSITPISRSQSKHTDKHMHEDDLNISPITQASCVASPSGVSHASGSPVTPQDAIKDSGAKFRPFSTPTEELNNIDLLSNEFRTAKLARNKHYTMNREGSFLGEDFHTGKEGNDAGYTKSLQSDIHNEDRMLSEAKTGEVCLSSRILDLSGESTMKYTGSEGSGSSGQSDNSSETRCRYCWVTRHISRDECPLTWSHVVKLAENLADNRTKFLDSDIIRHDQSKPTGGPEKLRKINKDECVLSDIPHPLPLTCQGQHLHKSQSRRKVLDDGKDPLEDWTSLNQGRLKVILVDGVIYRIVRLPTITIIEVYPGDGSVLVSQGMSAHFFLHIIPSKDQVEERTYSVKSPPQSMCGNHSVKSLMNRSHRLLAHVRQEMNTSSLNTGLCCWRHEEVQLEEPLSTVLLEDCSIPGYGKFTAMSNGQIKILFKDRTALDMTCDFSKRLKNCLNHSSVEGSVMVPNKQAGMCRLLLPNGHYQMVDIQHPGQYKKYIQMAKEWSDWVNSSPGERETFYRERLDSNMNVCVDRELQKIKCFNYVVDNTVLPKHGSDVSSTSAFRPYRDTAAGHRPGILRNIEQNKHSLDSNQQPKSHSTFKSVQIHSPPDKRGIVHEGQRSLLSSVYGDSETGNPYSNFAPPTSIRLNPIGQSQPIGVPVSKESVSVSSIGQLKPTKSLEFQDSSRVSNLEGFYAVRQALLKTSNVIKDLDALLDKR